MGSSIGSRSVELDLDPHGRQGIRSADANCRRRHADAHYPDFQGSETFSCPPLVTREARSIKPECIAPTFGLYLHGSLVGLEHLLGITKRLNAPSGKPETWSQRSRTCVSSWEANRIVVPAARSSSSRAKHLA